MRTKLAAALRWLAGGSFWDICFEFGLAESCFFNENGVLWTTIEAINAVEHIYFPCDDVDALSELAEGFAPLGKGWLPGCVMAIDGLAVRVRQPYSTEVDNVIAFRNRKGFWATLVMAGCDARGKFLMFSQKASGATNDETAWQLTTVYDAVIRKGQLPSQFYIIGDEGFVAHDQLLTPWGGSHLNPSRDAFNFYLSSQRQVIERAFGMLTQRFGVLRRPLRVALKRWSLVLTVCAKLHNLLVDHNIPITSVNDSDVCDGDLFETLLSSDVNGNGWAGRRRWEEQSERRNLFTANLQNAGMRRPTTSKH